MISNKISSKFLKNNYNFYTSMFKPVWENIKYFCTFQIIKMLHIKIWRNDKVYILFFIIFLLIPYIKNSSEILKYIVSLYCKFQAHFLVMKEMKSITIELNNMNIVLEFDLVNFHRLASISRLVTNLHINVG